MGKIFNLRYQWETEVCYFLALFYHKEPSDSGEIGGNIVNTVAKVNLNICEHLLFQVSSKSPGSRFPGFQIHLSQLFPTNRQGEKESPILSLIEGDLDCVPFSNLELVVGFQSNPYAKGEDGFWTRES